MSIEEIEMNLIVIMLLLSIFFIKHGTSKIEVRGPRCIPLSSKNIEGNPYHKSLLSIDGREIRSGFGLPILMDDMPSTKCPSDAISGCTLTVKRSYSTSITKGFSISLSESKSYGRSFR